MANIKRNAGKLGIANVISLALNFVSGILLTRILGAEGRGVLAKIEAGAGLLGQLTTLKSHMGVIYFIANEKIARQKIVTLALLIILSSLLLSWGIIIGLNHFGYSSIILPIGYDSDFFILYSLILFLLTQGRTIISGFLRGIKNFHEIYVNQLLIAGTKLLLFAGVFYAISLNSKQVDVQEGLLLHLSVVALAFASTVYFFLKNFNLKLDFSLPRETVLSPFFGFVGVSALALITGFLNLKLDIWLVEYFSGTENLGFYAVAVNLGALLLIFPSTIREVLMPYISSGNKEENLKNLAFFSRLNFTGIILVITFLIILAPYFIPFLYGKEFQQSVGPFQILILGIAFRGFAIVFSAYNYGSGAPKLNFYSNLIGLTSTICLGLFLIPKYGINGAAITSLASYAINAMVIFASVILVHKVSLAQFNFFLITGHDLAPIKKWIQDRLNS